MEKIARGLQALETTLDLVLTSPAVRAVQTAKILRKTFGLERQAVVETEHLAPTGYGDQLIELINGRYAGLEAIALVGHEPALGSLASMLISGDPGLSLTLKKGGVCRLTVDTLQYGRCATLDWLLSPAQLAELGD
jgi:phosphohistidine phosphatase